MIRIGNKIIGDKEPVFIIAEAGSNHDGKLEQAYQLIDIAASAGADAIKFQTFTADHIYPQTGEEAEYLKKMGINKPVYQIIKDAEMPKHWIPLLALRCKQKGIIFLSTPFDESAVDELLPYVSAYKIASYELTHLPLIRHVAKKGKPIIISTGASNIIEIQKAVSTIKDEGNNKIVVLQCTAKYPALLEDMNLKTISTMRKELGVLTGLSDHSRDSITAPIIAIALGAVIIEKHFTISNKLSGADHKFALEPKELEFMVQAIRKTKEIVGSGTKICIPAEQELANYRRTIFTIKNIKAGEELMKSNIRVLRKPGIVEHGLNPELFNELFGKKVNKDIRAYTILKQEDIEGLS